MGRYNKIFSVETIYEKYDVSKHPEEILKNIQGKLAITKTDIWARNITNKHTKSKIITIKEGDVCIINNIQKIKKWGGEFQRMEVEVIYKNNKVLIDAGNVCIVSKNNALSNTIFYLSPELSYRRLAKTLITLLGGKCSITLGKNVEYIISSDVPYIFSWSIVHTRTNISESIPNIEMFLLRILQLIKNVSKWQTTKYQVEPK